MAQIDLKNISVTFKQKNKISKAVQNVSLSIDKGDTYGIVGYSGAGKSTLVRVINRLQEPTKGEVFIDNQDILKFNSSKLRNLRHSIGIIFQHFNLMNSKTIKENILYPMLGDNKSHEEREKRIQHLIELVDLQGKENSYPAQLSGGQKQRVAIARALANNPEILISDEATSALDPKTTKDILTLLKRINQDLGVTIVLITHEMDVVKTVCNKVAVMDSGRLVEKGDILSIFSAPKHPMTKEFINTTNNFKEATETLKQQDYFLDVAKNNQLFHLKYVGYSTEQPIIINLYQKFGVISNIIYGNIEFIQDIPLGNLIIEIDANQDVIKEIKQYLLNKKIALTDIKLE
ncbi:methionine ABC transporter ATP-binding protein [Apilactobacillus quenuiae]|uniref:methionine ABC transporter ATP-binding protein n=1 Tax=Apilactobacillus quenuiae TaxID=2008377 RepID=UPI000D02146A|nr:methionine ABC transporter ATP-binding protein [Apilactobacillus quenuiae]